MKVPPENLNPLMGLIQETVAPSKTGFLNQFLPTESKMTRILQGHSDRFACTLYRFNVGPSWKIVFKLWRRPPPILSRLYVQRKALK